MAATSEPPPASVTAMQHRARPRQMSGRYFSLRASLPVQLPFVHMRLDFLLHEGPHGPAEHLVLVVEDVHHVPAPHFDLTASRSTPPSVARARASAKTTT